MLQKYCKLQPKTADELKVALQTIWGQLPQLHVNNVVTYFTKCVTTYKAVSASGGHLSICSNSVHFQVCILISSGTNWPQRPPSMERTSTTTTGQPGRTLCWGLIQACSNKLGWWWSSSHPAPLWLNSEFGTAYKYPDSTQLITNKLALSEPSADYWLRQCFKHWQMGLSWLKQHILSLSDILQQH